MRTAEIIPMAIFNKMYPGRLDWAYNMKYPKRYAETLLMKFFENRQTNQGTKRALESMPASINKFLN